MYASTKDTKEGGEREVRGRELAGSQQYIWCRRDGTCGNHSSAVWPTGTRVAARGEAPDLGEAASGEEVAARPTGTRAAPAASSSGRAGGLPRDVFSDIVVLEPSTASRSA